MTACSSANQNKPPNHTGSRSRVCVHAKIQGIALEALDVSSDVKFQELFEAPVPRLQRSLSLPDGHGGRPEAFTIMLVRAAQAPQPRTFPTPSNPEVRIITRDCGSMMRTARRQEQDQGRELGFTVNRDAAAARLEKNASVESRRQYLPPLGAQNTSNLPNHLSVSIPP